VRLSLVREKRFNPSRAIQYAEPSSLYNSPQPPARATRPLNSPYGPADSGAHAIAEVHSGWVQDWRFLATSDRLHSSDFAKSFQSMHLPLAVIDKIYRRNAQSMFSTAWSSPP